ncbi:hypothetical protein VitviT2T_028493 [Vitis vinifera]|uniref:Integrase catalytic domain-containing protein n=1 Tax=Vitis vinifera TaxID=29760 RepID=A0ABY9DTT6_VITVI|nr:hypothetical protein VitviT2T_028493 [Vitis vinifera]
MRNQGFESWTFRSCLGYQHFVINDKNRDQRKKDSKKTSTATVAEIKIEANVAEKASALVAVTDHGGKFLNTFIPVINSAWIIDSGATDHMTFDSRQTKDEVNLLFQNFHKVIETQYNAKVRVLRSDNGGEYQSSDLQKYLEGHDTIHQTTCFNTPQQNGVVERKNRHLLEVVRASLIAAKTPISYWGEAVTSAAYLINRGEYHKEIQTLDYDYHISEEDESKQSELVNQEAGELDMSDQQFGSEDVFIEIPNQLSFVEGVLNLEPDPFMKQLPHRHNRGCMVSEKQCQKVCKLKKSLYGLKQSPRTWFGRFTKSMRAFGYRQSNSYHTLFLKKQHGKIVTLIVYVDNMVVTGNDTEERKALQNYLSREFEMKDLGPLKYFLGIEVSRSSEGIFLSQRKYALNLLQETGISGCQPVNTPIEEGLKLCVEPNQISTDKGRYQRLVGRLMYLAHTRPDLAYALSVVSQYMHNPGEQHMNAVMRILRYLKNAPRKGILFAKNVDH